MEEDFNVKINEKSMKIYKFYQKISAFICVHLWLILLCFFVSAQTKQPKTVRDFFNLLPAKYFTLEGCEPSKDKNCDKARREYIDTFLETEDIANGFWKSGCDGAQSCLTMALFKRPDASYIVALKTEFEMGSDNYFIEYKGGKWFDISAKVIPQFSKNNLYELPRIGTTIEVYKKKTVDTDITERGAKLYDLIWKGGKFTIQK